MRSDFHSGKTWAPKGETPMARVTGQRFSLNMISAISPRGALRFMVVNATPLGLTTPALDFLEHRMHLWYLAATVMLGVFTAPISFAAQPLVTYRPKLRRDTLNILPST